MAHPHAADVADELLVCVTLEDVAKDAMRRQIFLSAFGDEQETMQLSFSFLNHVHRYKQLTGQKELLLNSARDIVLTYLRDSSAQLCVHLQTTPMQQLLHRIHVVLDAGTAPLDLFCGIEEHVKGCLANEKFPLFLRSPQYQELCDAIRNHRDLPLGEILVDHRRTDFLERFLQQSDPMAVGNLRFWVDVQTTFLPLIQTNLFSVALFEEIHTTVRKIFNVYLTESSSTFATRISEAIRKETLQKILQLQGEPFSPPRYANLFRAAQDAVWRWLQNDVYTRFKASPFYVLLVVEIENLESDHRLRRLSEHVQREKTHPTKSSAIVIPIHTKEQQQKATAMCNIGEVQQFKRTIALEELKMHQVESIAVYSVVCSAASTTTMSYDFFCGKESAASNCHMTYLDYCWNKQSIFTSPAMFSPSQRSQQPTPKSVLHDFVLPNGKEHLYGVCLTVWYQIDVCNDPTLSGLCNDDTNYATNAASIRWLPRFLLVTSHAPIHTKGRFLLQQLMSDPLDSMTGERILEILESIPCTVSPHPTILQAQYAGFYLQSCLDCVDMPLHWIAKLLSTQTIVSLVALLLAEKSLILVSQRPTALVVVGEALKELLRPFQWQHFYLPFCPIGIAAELSKQQFFSTTLPFIIGFEETLVLQKQKDSGTDQRYRIRNSLYNVHKVPLQLQLPPLGPHFEASGSTSSYPPEILQTSAIILDIDADDIYVPNGVEVPELPHSVVRAFEGVLKKALLHPEITNADSHLFNTEKGSTLLDQMLLTVIPRNSQHSATDWPFDIGVRLALLWFLDALFGDVIYHFCSFPKAIQPPTDFIVPDSGEGYIIFEADSFLDAHIELGCRDFFRQCFQTELFRDFLRRQHLQFTVFDSDTAS